MDKRILICIAIIFLIGVLIFLFFYYFEIVPVKTYVPPSQEYYSNNFLALERWFKEAGIPVTYLDEHSLFYNNETDRYKTILLTRSFYTLWEKPKVEIMQWMNRHKNVIICLNQTDNTKLNENLVEFLLNFGITIGVTAHYYTYSTEDTPDYHWRYKFDVNEDTNYIVNYDIFNNIRIIGIPLENGILTIMGTPSFMWNDKIEKEANARLTWELLANVSDQNGIVIVQYYNREPRIRRSLFGALIQRGNLFPVLAPVILLIIFGFWMVIPVFGIVKEEKQRSSRPIKERFTAEISFLKKYKGLYYYDDAIKKIRGEL